MRNAYERRIRELSIQGRELIDGSIQTANRPGVDKVVKLANRVIKTDNGTKAYA